MAGLETTLEKRGELLRKAVAYAEEAIGLYRQLGIVRYLLIALSSRVRHGLALAMHEHSPVDPKTARFCHEGQQAAAQFGKSDLAEWFAAVNAAIEKGLNPE